MTKQKVWPFLAPVFILGILLFSFYDQLVEFHEALPSPLIGKPVPAFRLTVLADEHHEITQQAFQGEMYLLNVWASWCTTCEREHPFLMSITGKSGVPPMIGLNYKDERNLAKEWLKAKGNPYKQSIFDPEGTLGLDLGVYGVPETYLIDNKGIIRYKWVGRVTAEVWHDKLLPAIKRVRQRGGAA